jgi:hypothetical protein
VTVRRRPLVPVLALGASLAALTWACASEAPPETTASGTAVSVSQADADAMIGGLCEMSNELRDDVGGGRTVFYDAVHERLHRLAAEVQGLDAVLAGALLEAKQLVEADLGSPDPPPAYGAHLDGLLPVAQEAVVLLGLGDPGCPG